MGEEIGVKRLKRQRQGHRTYAKKVCEKVDNLLAEFSEENRGKAKTFADVLNEKLGILSDLDSSIVDNIDDEDIEKEI